MAGKSQADEGASFAEHGFDQLGAAAFTLAKLDAGNAAATEYSLTINSLRTLAPGPVGLGH